MLRCSVGFACEVGKATHGLKYSSKPWARGIGSGLTEASQPQHDETRVCLLERFKIQTPSCQGARTEVLYEDIRILEQPK